MVDWERQPTAAQNERSNSNCIFMPNWIIQNQERFACEMFERKTRCGFAIKASVTLKISLAICITVHVTFRRCDANIFTRMYIVHSVLCAVHCTCLSLALALASKLITVCRSHVLPPPPALRARYSLQICVTSHRIALWNVANFKRELEYKPL